ncbi:glucose/quinate/shikimate family membrane-bound PQQ-dependent dehydrogenase [Lichenicola cladoniae]|uniref:Glucose/quinate/shikimate family membrane-bound PQQ-dependent dehydrogenase n=1 Tax=Lichenicola cladoniae TaxID=1484109 RepID=A0A6M8HR75_9PROT|nr:glucose/quinate/shikimate family membrane-bound PQQ-dependent dehydrogenase [Lichenicola cladoniae]NPD68794.1 glucose/quinate/shikimate family membrane-bound PQQ-dependent dehydrogenase [Acetobacteraceae bacterium]QKE90785.1 glucose/quinate/shikimate family membrane-bound PQQ-dependent dehydrogenase [Lichenicola cladoniae]
MSTSTSRRPHKVLLFTGLLYSLAGLALAGGGLWLASLGGSLFYLIAGLGILLTGVLLVARRSEALWVYAAVLIGTMAWSIWEIGFDWWPLAARGDVIFPLGLWLLTPWIRRGLDPEYGRGFHRNLKRASAGGASARPAPVRRAGAGPLWIGVAAGVVVLLVGLVTTHNDLAGVIDNGTTGPAPQDYAGQPDEDWHAYGRTQFGTRFSPLSQITPANANQLKVAWVFRTGDVGSDQDPKETTFEVTPIKVRDTLYLCSQHQKLFAVDARNGTLRWSYDPKLYRNPTFQHLTCRGVSYSDTPAGSLDTEGKPVPAECPHAIFLPVNDGRMVKLDADTGKLCEGFGDHGTLGLIDGMGERTPGYYEPTSPPVVSDQILVVAGAVIDNYSTHEPSGVVRGFDIHTGRLVWAWDAGNPDENEMPSATHHYTNNSPNSWMTASYDAKLGLVYLPMGVQTPDIWGGNRTPASERYSSALVALDIKTGHRVWSYQTVHHDLWDMDLPSQPTLVDLNRPEGVVPAILVPAKTGNLFVLNRQTGALIVPAPETAVPGGAAPGDHVSPTQPFSELSFRPKRNLVGADMWGATIYDQLACRIMFHRLRYEGPFTPPSLQGTLVFPGNLGMFEWGGVAVDQARQLVIANPMAIPFVSTLIPRGPDNPAAPNNAHPSGSEVGVQPMYGSPFGVNLHPFLSPIGLPCKRPPWGYMAGIDLKTMKIVWQHRNGTIRDEAPLPIPIKMGVPMLGGPLTTAGGVAFLTGTLDYYIRAYDVRDGHQLWQDRLPAGGQSTPMSYAVDGKQFVVTAAGGHGSFGTKRGDYVIAYTLQ